MFIKSVRDRDDDRDRDKDKDKDKQPWTLALQRTPIRQTRALVTPSRYAAPCIRGTIVPNGSSSPSRCSARRQTYPRPAEHPSPSIPSWPAPTYPQSAFCRRFLAEIVRARQSRDSGIYDAPLDRYAHEIPQYDSKDTCLTDFSINIDNSYPQSLAAIRTTTPSSMLPISSSASQMP